MVLPIRYYGDPVLRAQTKLVTAFNASLRALIHDTLETLYDIDGAGLAAPQVGHSLRFFVLDLAAGGRTHDFNCTLDGKSVPNKLLFPLIVINPVLELLPSSTTIHTEGCLSFKDLWLDVERPDCVCLRYQDIDGNKHIIESDGILARAIQHEYDHLEGILFIDHISPSILKRYESKLKRLRRESRDYLKKSKPLSQSSSTPYMSSASRTLR
jgi:peptide deformylase